MFNRLIEKLYLREKNNLAYYDVQTKTHNRNWFEAVAKTEYKNKKIFITMIDIDNFKEINDTFGHALGDITLMNVARDLSQFFSGSDVVRFGGDEFLLFTDKNPGSKLSLFNNRTDFQISYGVAFKDKNDDIDATIQKADKKMYKMKKQSKEK